MKSTDVTGWTDLSPDSRFRNRVPSTIISADEIANGEWDTLLGDSFNGGVEREVIYDDGTTKWWMVLTLYVQPTGAGALAINPATAYATNHEGRLLLETGVLASDGAQIDAIAGLLLSHYSRTSSEIGSTTVRQPVWETSLAEGDAIWLIRRGRVEMRPGANVAAGERLVTDEATTGGHLGCVRPSIAMAGPTGAQIEEHLPGPGGQCIGIAKVTLTEAAAIAASSYALCKLDLGPRFYR